MSSELRRRLATLALLAVLALATGCVERRFVVNSDPAGAIVLVNGRPLGASPADDHFVYYGNYHFTVIKDGYETLQVDQYVRPPWYEYPVLDFISENMVPWMIRDVRRFHYSMLPLQVPNARKLQDDAAALRSRGQAVPSPVPAPTPVATGPAPQ
jgi:hypothetical protein